MEGVSESEMGARGSIAAFLDRIESIYLRILRSVVLVIATLLVVYAAWLVISGLYKTTRSPSSVIEKQSVVAPEELTDAEAPATLRPADKPTIDPERRAYYTGFLSQYFHVFENQFEPYRQPEDKLMTSDEFDDAFIKTNDRLAAVSSGDLLFSQDREDLDALLRTMTKAAVMPNTKHRLEKYRNAKKVTVTKSIQRTRTVPHAGWDSSSESCDDWYRSPIGCAVVRTVEEPYTETVTALEFPPGTQSHTQIFRAFQDRFFKLLNDRRQANRREAETEREAIRNGRTEGGVSLVLAIQVLAGFLLLMFFFLLIALERHQRKIAQSVDFGGPSSA
jgi:hypothetical protein